VTRKRYAPQEPFKILKLFQVVEGRLSSIMQCQAQYCLSYAPDVETRPTLEGSLLFCYRKEKHALEAWNVCPEEWQLWRGKATGVRTLRYRAYVHSMDYAEFWRMFNCGEHLHRRNVDGLDRKVQNVYACQTYTPRVRIR